MSQSETVKSEKGKLLPKCTNCKFAGINSKKKGVLNSMCLLPMSKYWKRTRKKTTNSKGFTHCDMHEFVKGTKSNHQTKERK